MALLKKIKASTLMETMVATVLIVIVFMVASLVMNSQVQAITEGNILPVETQLRKLEYQVIHDKIELPYLETQEGWLLEVQNDGEFITLTAVRETGGRRIERKISTSK